VSLFCAYFQVIPPHKLHILFILRFFRIRQLKERMLGNLNYFRSIQKRLVIDSLAYGFEDRFQFNADHILRSVSSAAPAPLHPFGQSGGHDPDSKHKGPIRPHCGIGNFLPTDYERSTETFMKFSGLEPRDDVYSWTARRDSDATEQEEIQVADCAGAPIVYDAALTDLKLLEEHLLKIGTVFIDKARNNAKGHDLVDRWAVLLDLHECESAFQLAKRRLLDVLLEAYDHTLEPIHQRSLAQHIFELLELSPSVDLDTDSYFPQACLAHAALLEQKAVLFRSVLQHLSAQANDARTAWSEHHWQYAFSDPAAALRTRGPSAHGAQTFSPSDEQAFRNLKVKASEASSVEMLEFCPNAHLLSALDSSLDAVAERLITLSSQPLDSQWSRLCLARAVVFAAARKWLVLRNCPDISTLFPSVHSSLLQALSKSAMLSGLPLVRFVSQQAGKELSDIRDAAAVASAQHALDNPSNERVNPWTTALYGCVRMLEALRIRQSLLELWYESCVLTSLYLRQATTIGRTPLIFLTPTFRDRKLEERANQRFTARYTPEIKDPQVDALGPQGPYCLAATEFPECLPFNLVDLCKIDTYLSPLLDDSSRQPSVAGTQNNISSAGTAMLLPSTAELWLTSLRRTLSAQNAHLHLLSVAVQFHHVLQAMPLEENDSVIDAGTDPPHSAVLAQNTQDTPGGIFANAANLPLGSSLGSSLLNSSTSLNNTLATTFQIAPGPASESTSQKSPRLSALSETTFLFISEFKLERYWTIAREKEKQDVASAARKQSHEAQSSSRHALQVNAGLSSPLAPAPSTLSSLAIQRGSVLVNFPKRLVEAEAKGPEMLETLCGTLGALTLHVYILETVQLLGKFLYLHFALKIHSPFTCSNDASPGAAEAAAFTAPQDSVDNRPNAPIEDRNGISTQEKARASNDGAASHAAGAAFPGEAVEKGVGRGRGARWDVRDALLHLNSSATVHPASKADTSNPFARPFIAGEAAKAIWGSNGRPKDDCLEVVATLVEELEAPWQDNLRRSDLEQQLFLMEQTSLAAPSSFLWRLPHPRRLLQLLRPERRHQLCHKKLRLELACRSELLASAMLAFSTVMCTDLPQVRHAASVVRVADPALFADPSTRLLAAASPWHPGLACAPDCLSEIQMLAVTHMITHNLPVSWTSRSIPGVGAGDEPGAVAPAHNESAPAVSAEGSGPGKFGGADSKMSAAANLLLKVRSFTEQQQTKLHGVSATYLLQLRETLRSKHQLLLQQLVLFVRYNFERAKALPQPCDPRPLPAAEQVRIFRRHEEPGAIDFLSHTGMVLKRIERCLHKYSCLEAQEGARLVGGGPALPGVEEGMVACGSAYLDELNNSHIPKTVLLGALHGVWVQYLTSSTDFQRFVGENLTYARNESDVRVCRGTI
jgi:hypothetical protein